jgi:colanic acid biosynthesis glycosyl transferase WcaI
MLEPSKVVIVSQHYPPDLGTTAAIMSKISEHLAAEGPVLVLSGWPGSATNEPASSTRPVVVEIRNQLAAKGALIKRAAAETSFTIRAFLTALRTLRRGDVALTVTAPFMLPYAVVVAAKLKRAQSALIMHDLYPDVLVMAGILKPSSIAAKAMRAANALMFRALNAIVIIGRDTERLLLRSGAWPRDKIIFIPNWATLSPGVRPVRSDNRYRRGRPARFVVGLSGNLGFTHDPLIVFEAARLLSDDPDIHFLLSGWGRGFDRLKEMQSEARLANVTLIDRVEDDCLEELLAAANVCLIPYRKDVAGVSVPSRFYNLLAVGRPVILVSEPDAEAALTVREYDVGWVTPPGDAAELASTVRLAFSSEDPDRAERAAAVAGRFNLAAAMAGYSAMIRELRRKAG